MILSILGCLIWLTLTIGLCLLLNKQRGYADGVRAGRSATERAAREWLRRQCSNTKKPQEIVLVPAPDWLIRFCETTPDRRKK